MEITNKDNENRITLKDFIGWVVLILTALISTKFFDNFKDNELVKFFFISLATSFFTTFVWIKFFSNKKDNKLVNRLIKEVEAKKDLERQKGKLEESLERKQTLLYHAEKDKEKLEKENEKLENERNQLQFVLSRCGISEEEISIDENIPLYKWEEKPGLKEKIEKITQKNYKKWREAERDVFNLSLQLEKSGIPKQNQHVGDKRLRKWGIESVENHWISRSDKNNKIRGKTLEQFLGTHWKNSFENKEGDDIYKEFVYLTNKINNFADGK